MDKETLGLNIPAFLPTIAPFHPSKPATRDCIKRLKRLGIINEAGTWTAFKALPSQFCGTPCGKRRSKGDKYGGFGVLCEAIASYRYRGRKATCEYVVKPAASTTGSCYRPDGHFRLVDPEFVLLADEDGQSANVACGVFCADVLESSGSGTWQSKYAQPGVVGAANFELRNDPIRNQTYSMSVKEGQVSFWYWARSHCVKVDEFSFMDVEMFVSSLMSIIFATKEELGYNSHITRQLDASNNIFHIFEINGRYFKTLDVIFEQWTERVMSRATRVWLVQEIEGLHDLSPKAGSKQKALKDFWLEEGVKSEKDIQAAIFDDLEAFIANLSADRDTFLTHPPEELKLASETERDRIYQCLMDGTYKKYFVGIDDDFDDMESLTKPVDFWTGHYRRGPDFQPLQVWDSAGTHKYTQMRRSFIIYDDVCECIEEMTDLLDVFYTMEGALIALQLMSLVGWIHRDISSGNVMAVRPGPNQKFLGKLGDLEWAKKASLLPLEDTPPEQKRGTAHYMAVEIQKEIHAERYIRLTGDLQVEPILVSREEEADVVHTLFHDVESFLWLSLHFVTEGVDHFESQVYASQIFPKPPGWNHCPEHKYRALLHDGYMAYYLRSPLHKCFSNGKTPSLAYSFEQLRECLAAYYKFRDAESAMPGRLFSKAFDLVENAQKRLANLEHSIDALPLSEPQRFERKWGGPRAPDNAGEDVGQEPEPRRAALRVRDDGAPERPNKVARTALSQDVKTVRPPKNRRKAKDRVAAPATSRTHRQTRVRLVLLNHAPS